MGNPAVVALSNQESTYDLYYSHDGAFNLQLYPILQLSSHQAGKASYADILETMKAPQSKLGTQRDAEMQLWRRGMEMRGSDHPVEMAEYDKLLNPDPLQVNVEAADVPKHVTPDKEVVYVVEENDCTVYDTFWLGFNILEWLDKYVDIEIYDRDRLPSIAQADALFERSPDYTISRGEYAEILEEGTTSSPRRKILTKFYQYLGTSLIFIADEARNEQGSTGFRLIDNDWLFRTELAANTNPDMPLRNLLFAEFPFSERTDEEYLELADRWRFTTYDILLEPTRAYSFGDSDLETVTKDAIIALCKEYGDALDISFNGGNTGRMVSQVLAALK